MSPDPHQPLRGAVPVLVMPFDDRGAIEEDSLRRLIDFCEEAGARAIAFGVGSESLMLTDEERERVWTLAAHHLDGRLPLVAATTHASLEGTVSLSHLARECGVSCTMVDAQPRKGEDLVGFYRTLSERVPIGLMIQDAAGNAPAGDLLAAARAASRAVTLKLESPGAPGKIGRVVEGLRSEGLSGAGDRTLTVVGGANGNFLPEELSRGAVGTLPHPALIDAYADVCARADSGDAAGARDAYFRRIYPFLRAVAASGAPGAMIAVHKALFERAGILSSAFCRLRAEALPDWLMDRVWAHLDEAGLAISARFAQ